MNQSDYNLEHLERGEKLPVVSDRIFKIITAVRKMEDDPDVQLYKRHLSLVESPVSLPEARPDTKPEATPAEVGKEPDLAGNIESIRQAINVAFRKAA